MHRTPDLRCALQRSSVAQAAQAMGMDGDVGGFLEETEDSWRDVTNQVQIKAFTAWPIFGFIKL
jgi:hypothetical protein